MEFTIPLTKTTVALLFSTLMLIQMADSFYSCKEPSQIGDASFTDLNILNKDSKNMVINVLLSLLLISILGLMVNFMLLKEA